MNLDRWDPARDGPLSEKSLRSKLESRGYSVVRFVYPRGRRHRGPPRDHAQRGGGGGHGGCQPGCDKKMHPMIVRSGTPARFMPAVCGVSTHSLSRALSRD